MLSAEELVWADIYFLPLNFEQSPTSSFPPASKSLRYANLLLARASFLAYRDESGIELPNLLQVYYPKNLQYFF